MSNFDLDKAINRFDRFTSGSGDVEVRKKDSGNVVYLDDISDEEDMIIDDNTEEYTSSEEYYEPPPKRKYIYKDVPETIKYEVPKPESKEEVKKFSGLLGRRLFQ